MKCVQTVCSSQAVLRAKESQDFGSQEADERLGEHFSRLLCCVVEEVLWVSQHIEQRLHELLVLVKKKQKQNNVTSGLYTNKSPKEGATRSENQTTVAQKLVEDGATY